MLFYSLVVLIPFFTFLVILLFGNVLGNKGSGYLSTANLGLSFLFAFYLFFSTLGSEDLLIIRFFPWIYIGDLEVYWDFYYDFLTLTMFVVVTFISFLVHF